MNTVIQYMAGHAAVTDTPQDLCHLPHDTLSSPHTRFCVRPCVHSVLLPSHSGSPHISPGVIYFTFSLIKFQDQS